MKLIIGGAYQGKLETAMQTYDVKESDIYSCKDDIDFSYSVINKLEEYILHLVRSGKDPVEFISSNLEKFKDKIVILQDISTGVVPVDQELRLWREEVGRIGVLLAKNADEVLRVFCGIATKLK